MMNSNKSSFFMVKIHIIETIDNVTKYSCEIDVNKNMLLKINTTHFCKIVEQTITIT